MEFIGIDVHKRESQVCILAAGGEVGPYRVPWADLLKHVFGVDVLCCAACGGRMKVLAFVQERTAVRRILEHLGLDATCPRLERARGPPEPTFEW
ncbi:hypothetical protein [Hyalangium sp.]|uniref:hypothetical protein n=1 Tax=Hyalangium sp. TaxID=2028555 RepID=UPI002D4FF0B0|nr:hypothetical protein [Hyalangium sp.]HYH99342.1 hypothetical protein [Hyalangium sp.]